LENKAAGPAHEEGASPRYQVWVDPFGTQHAAGGEGVDIVEATLDVEKERRDFPLLQLKGSDVI